MPEWHGFMSDGGKIPGVREVDPVGEGDAWACWSWENHEFQWDQSQEMVTKDRTDHHRAP